MARRHPLEGIIKFSNRESWIAELERVTDEHLGAVLSEFDIEVAELPDVIGEGRFFTLWACVIEDLAAREFDGRNIVDDYLKRRGWKETARTRAYLKALRESAISLYEVSDIRRGDGFVARDLLRGGDLVRVTDNSNSHPLVEWDRIAARVLNLGDRSELSGGVLLFERSGTDEVIVAAEEMMSTSVEDMAEELRRFVGELAADDDEDADAALDSMQGREAELVASMKKVGFGFLLSSEWLRQILQREHDQAPMELVDGDPVEGISVHYPLEAGTTAAQIRKTLERIPGIRRNAPNVWDWTEDVPESASEPEGETVLVGMLLLEEDTLTLATISANRSSRGRALIEEALAGLLDVPYIERQTQVELLRDAVQRKAEEIGLAMPPSDVPAEERQKAIHDFFENYYASVLDEPLADLGDRVPREAAKSDEDGPKVVEWLKGVENHHARKARNDPAWEYDCRWMWKELDLEAYRRP